MMGTDMGRPARSLLLLLARNFWTLLHNRGGQQVLGCCQLLSPEGQPRRLQLDRHTRCCGLFCRAPVKGLIAAAGCDTWHGLAAACFDQR